MSYSRIKAAYKLASVLTFTVQQWLSRELCTSLPFLVQSVITVSVGLQRYKSHIPSLCNRRDKPAHSRRCRLSRRPCSTAESGEGGEIRTVHRSCDPYQIVKLAAPPSQDVLTTASRVCLSLRWCVSLRPPNPSGNHLHLRLREELLHSASGPFSHMTERQGRANTPPR